MIFDSGAMEALNSGLHAIHGHAYTASIAYPRTLQVNRLLKQFHRDDELLSAFARSQRFLQRPPASLRESEIFDQFG